MGQRQRQRKIETSPVKATATGELSKDDRAVRWRRRGRLVERDRDAMRAGREAARATLRDRERASKGGGEKKRTGLMAGRRGSLVAQRPRGAGLVWSALGGGDQPTVSSKRCPQEA
jgi:hypothetical protein